MGFFSRFRAADPQVPQPLTFDRLVELHKREGWSYFIDNDGDLGSQWEGAVFFFLFGGKQKEVLQVQARFPAVMSGEQFDVLRDVAEEIHRRKPLPELVFTRGDQGELRIMANCFFDFDKGVTLDQLRDHVTDAVWCTNEAFKQLDAARMGE